MPYTTTQFIANVKTRAAIPTSQSTYTNSKILAIGDAELRTYLLPMIMKAQEHYYAFDVDTTINATGIYEIPTRSVGGKVLNVAAISGEDRLDLAWLTEDSLTRYDQTNDSSAGVYLKRSQLYLVPRTISGFTTLRQTIVIRPGQFIEIASAAQITGISGTTLTFASGSIPATFTTAASYDLIQDKPHFDHLGIDLSASSVTTTTVVLSATPSSRLAVGDWLTIAGTSPVVQAPVELHPLLEQATANTILRAQGDLEKLAAGEKKIKEMADATNLYTPRIESEGKKILNRSRITRRS